MNERKVLRIKQRQLKRVVKMLDELWLGSVLFPPRVYQMVEQGSCSLREALKALKRK